LNRDCSNADDIIDTINNLADDVVSKDNENSFEGEFAYVYEEDMEI